MDSTHCIRFANNTKFAENCAHQHTLFCDRCESGNSCFDTIEEAIEQAAISQDLKQTYLWMYRKGKEAIFGYRSHIIR